jgi:glutamate 5-kinase
MEKKIIVVKLGSQTIIRENGELHVPQLENLIQQIIELEKQNCRVI